MTIDLFTPVVSPERQHPVYQMLMHPPHAPERAVIARWAEGFQDRDGKFVQEFQMTFESGFWELYLHAALKEWNLPVDMRHHAPDFLVGGDQPFGMEATIAAPAQGGKPAYGYSVGDIPHDFTQFNIESTLRICNSFDGKVKRYRKYYEGLPHMVDIPFVIAIASFDRPLAHFAALRPVRAAIYGVYHDEAMTPKDAKDVVSYNVSAAPKSETVNIDLGLFCDDTYADVSAVIYSSLVTWGKLRALADNPTAHQLFTTFHPNRDSIEAKVRHTKRADYSEHLMDGLCVLHNPFAKRPLPKSMFAHPRIMQATVAPDGDLFIDSPDDFLLVRMVQAFVDHGTAFRHARLAPKD
ncbi:glycosaminoglycan attachment site [Cupriavidus basilensis]|uniref:glycosaminoglycan attachment site n=1 Tax=Cupriavidus basilensis TaxID=68895 RepID=UPI0020A6D8A6|nr:glycosaminoglycan attachment site [Cupriavidus basilensis]MCP3018184.1 glycosaminoglycan attachment site [Cupriavidus basilensis]